jgi:hypothetical protein
MCFAGPLLRIRVKYPGNPFEICSIVTSSWLLTFPRKTNTPPAVQRDIDVMESEGRSNQSQFSLVHIITTFTFHCLNCQLIILCTLDLQWTTCRDVSLTKVFSCCYFNSLNSKYFISNTLMWNAINKCSFPERTDRLRNKSNYTFIFVFTFVVFGSGINITGRRICTRFTARAQFHGISV